MRFTAEDLHRAHELLNRNWQEELGDDAEPVVERLQLITFDEIARFIDGSEWHAQRPDGPEMRKVRTAEINEISMALGISIGLLAARAGEP